MLITSLHDNEATIAYFHFYKSNDNPFARFEIHCRAETLVRNDVVRQRVYRENNEQFYSRCRELSHCDNTSRGINLSNGVKNDLTSYGNGG